MTASKTLLVVGLSDRREPVLLERAANVARALGLTIYVYYPISDTAMSFKPSASSEVSHASTKRLESCHVEFENALETFRAHGLRADGCIQQRSSISQAVIDQIGELVPRLVMMAPKSHGPVAQMLLADDDFALIRRCPVPLWFSRRLPYDSKPILLAAVDPANEDDDATATNHAVLDQTTELASAMGKRTHIVHAFGGPSRLRRVIEAAAPRFADDQYGRMDDYHTAQVHELAKRHGISKEHIHLSEGPLLDNLRYMAREMDVDLLVVGALSKNPLKRVLIGGTAEKLLATVHTDVLIVKAP